MKLHIISPYEIKEQTIVWLEINTPVGNMVIQNNHAPMIIELSKNTDIFFMLPSGKQSTVSVPQGFAHVTREEVKILISQAI